MWLKFGFWGQSPIKAKFYYFFFGRAIDPLFTPQYVNDIIPQIFGSAGLKFYTFPLLNTKEQLLFCDQERFEAKLNLWRSILILNLDQRPKAGLPQ